MQKKAFGGLTQGSQAQCNMAPLPALEALRVVTRPFEPVVIYQDKQYTGFSIESIGVTH